MNRLVLGLFMFASSFSILNAQRIFDPTNSREGESVEYCHQHVKLEDLRVSNPAAYQQMMNDRMTLENETRNFSQTKSGVVYTIPIVFHVLHNNGAENISHEQILDAVAILNRDFRRLNADANSVQTPFIGMPADAEIEFKLATIAPNGTCFNGVTRTQSALTVEGAGGGAGQMNAAFNGNNVYQGTWSHEKYLNVIVAKQIGGAAGYTYNPNNWGGVGSNSIWMLSNYVGSIGTGEAGRSRALTHEVGHWLNLDHTWGPNNNPGNAASCSQDDQVADTPLCIGVTGCSLSSNTCDDTASSMSSWTTNVVDNVENYMDYSYCSKMYTPGQVTRMRAAIVSTIGGRNKLWTTANLNAVGAIANPPICKAEFTASKLVVCVGETVQFSDESYNSVDGWSWTFNGGSPATSTVANPTVSYAAPGTYSVTLSASSAGNSVSTTKTAYITVLGNPSSLPLHEGFEAYTTLANTDQKVFQVGGFEITSSAAHTGAKSVKYSGFGQTAANIASLTSGSIDLSQETIGNVTFSFRYAYRKKEAATQEFLKLYFSSDCGSTFGAAKKVFTATSMSNVVVPTNWTPTAADWKTVHVPFSNSTFASSLVSNFRYKFDFEAKNGNNFYLDDINIYRGSESDNIVVGIDEVSGLNDVVLYPNPADAEINVNFSLVQAQKIALTVMDISGKEIKSTVINGNVGENLILIDSSEFATGVYLIQLKSDSTNKTLQFIKK